MGLLWRWSRTVRRTYGIAWPECCVVLQLTDASATDGLVQGRDQRRQSDERLRWRSNRLRRTRETHVLDVGLRNAIRQLPPGWRAWLASVAQGAAAAARVLGRIQMGELPLEPVRASVIEENCSGCKICNTMCPFNAISFIEDRMVTEINPALCQGCGTCVAACPSGAITGTQFSNEQVLAQLEGLLMLNVNGGNGSGVKEPEPVPA